MGRKIKHYSSGYQIKRKKRRRIISSALFIMLLAFLVFVGYVGAKALHEVSLKKNVDSDTLSSLSDTLLDGNGISDIGSISESAEDSANENDETSEKTAESNSETGSEADSLYSKYDSASDTYMPVKENPFSKYGEPEVTYTPVPDLPKQADTESLKAITMPLETALSTDAAREFIEEIDTEVYNAVVIPLKDKNGTVYYSTKSSVAISSGAISGEKVDLESIISLIKSKGLKPAAQIYSLQDNISAHTRYGTSYYWMNDGSTTWLDAKAVNGGKPWMNPYCTATISYLEEIAAELDEAGFVDLIVYGNQYPDSTLQQKMGLGETGGVSKLDQLQNVLDAMQEAAQGLRVVPAYQGACYTSGVNTQVYTDTPNAFTFTPSAPIVGDDLSILDNVTADISTLIPVIGSENLITSLSERGIDSYILS